MNKNKYYEVPTSDVVELMVESAVLAASAEHSTPELGE